MYKATLLFCLLSLASTIFSSKIEGQYNIFFTDSSTKEQRDAHFRARSGTVLKTYDQLNGYTAQLTDSEVVGYLNDPSVKLIESDATVKLSSISFGRKCSLQFDAPWGLDRLAERYPLDNSIYRYPTIGGEDTVIYVVDTGVYCENNDFQADYDKCSFGYKTNDTWTDGDWFGHGTHVASIAIGNIYGVAKKSSVISVKVFGEEYTPWSDVIDGINWALAHKTTKKKIINLSLGDLFEVSANEVMNKAVSQGAVVTVAAGNEYDNACTYSPGTAKATINVGATGLNTTTYPYSDYRADFSNYGPCVDIMAPGDYITAAWIGSPDATLTISGTSMAAPFVAGISAIHLSEGVPPSQIKNTLISEGTKDLIDMDCDLEDACLETPNVLSYNSCGRW